MKHSEADALYVAQTVFPRATEAINISKGYSHDVFEVKTNSFPKQIIVRFANENPEKYSLKKEIRINQLLQKLGIPVPKVIYFGKKKREKRILEFVILYKVEGTDLSDIFQDLSKKEQSQLARKMGEILGKIHSQRFEQYGTLLPEGIYSEDNFSLKEMGKGRKVDCSIFTILSWVFSDLGKVASYKGINKELIGEIANYVLANKKFAKEEEKPALIHGDFDIINIRVKKIGGEWKITSIFDFEYAASLKKEYDFIKLHRAGFLDQTHLRKSLLAGYRKYQKINKDFIKVVNYLRLTRDIGYLQVLLKSGDEKTASIVLNNIRKTITKVSKS